MDAINDVLTHVNDVLWTYGLIIILLGAGIYFTIGTGFVQFRHLFTGLRSLREDPLSFGSSGLTNYQAFSVSVASRIGVGTITGITTAIAIGGPGVVFWIWVLSLVGMASGFVEGVLAQIYKVDLDGKGRYVGGPAYYLSKALGHKFLAGVFAILMVIVYGISYNFIQMNAIAQSMNVYDFDPLWVGLFTAFLAFLVIAGGQTRIAGFCSLAVPAMIMVYIFLVLLMLIIHFSEIPAFFKAIFSNAFTGKAALGGAIGTVIMQGVKRGFFASESGEGSAPHAAAIATTSHPVKQGSVQLFAIFFEMFVICGGTAFIIITSQFYNVGNTDGFIIMQQSISTQLDIFGNFALILSVILFAFTSVLGNYFYAEANLRYLTKNSGAIRLFRIVASACLVVGALSTIDIILNVADFLMAFIAIINVYAIVRLFPVVRDTLRNYDDQVFEGENPVFSREVLRYREAKHDKLVWPKTQEEAKKLYEIEEEDEFWK